MADDKKTLPPRYVIPVSFYFKVEITDIAEVSFMEVGGLTMETAVEELTEGGENRFSHRLPGRSKFGNLVLKRGMIAGDSKLADWVEDGIINHLYTPKTVSVSLLKPSSENNGAEVLRQWQFERAFPVKWVVSDFKSTDNNIVIETFELSYQFFKRIKK